MIYDTMIDVATLHRRVQNYEGRVGEALIGTALWVLGTVAVVALARRNENCYNRHITSYRNYRTQTTDKIMNNDKLGVGSAAWHAEIHRSHESAMHELGVAFGCLR